MQSEALIDLLKKIRHLGKIKLDTNGNYPDVIKKIIKLKLVDYIAMDIKAPFNPEFYGKVCGLVESGEKFVTNVKRSYEIISNNKEITFEARLTIVPGLIESEKDVMDIIRHVPLVDIFTLQQFRADMGTLDPSLKDTLSPKREDLLKLARHVKPFMKQVRIRTLERGEEIIND